jgi:hypothetical protein
MKHHANLTQETIQESFVDENGEDNGVSARITDERRGDRDRDVHNCHEIRKEGRCL